jgi:hypothetical protein
MAYEIIYLPEAVDHLRALPKNSQALVLDQVDVHLTNQPTLQALKPAITKPMQS